MPAVVWQSHVSALILTACDATADRCHVMWSHHHHSSRNSCTRGQPYTSCTAGASASEAAAGAAATATPRCGRGFVRGGCTVAGASGMA